MRSLVIFTLIVIAITAASDISGQASIDVPAGRSAITDGTIDAAEWADAATFDLKGGGKLFLMHDGEFLYAGVRGTKQGWSHLYLNRGNGSSVEVLHASAALGRIVYAKDAAGRWQTSDRYKWELRGREFNEAKIKAIDEYLLMNGWVASNNNMGTPAETEFKVKLDDREIRIAVVHAFDNTGFTYFPAALADDALKSELVVGNTPADLVFDIRQWARINLKGETKKRIQK